MSIAGSKSVRAGLALEPKELSTLRKFPVGGPSRQEADFCRHLELLNSWRRRKLRILDMPQGSEVLVWLLKGGTRARPLKDLYRVSRFSEPTIRWVLKALADDGFITIERNPDDLRVRTVHLAPKLIGAVREYLGLLHDCAMHLQRAVTTCDEPGDRAAD